MKAELFDKVVGALDEAVDYHRGAKLNLRTTTLPEPPKPVTSETVKRVRDAVNASQAVFARYLNVSTKTVQAWEGGTRPVAGPALLLFQIAQRHPSVVFPRSKQIRGHVGASQKPSKHLGTPAHMPRKVAAKGAKSARRA